MQKKKALLLLVITVFILAGCATKKKKTVYGGGPEKLYAKGLARFNRGKYQTAIEILQDVKNYYPESPEAVRAEIRMADAHFWLLEYEEAIAIYQEFRKLHPYHEDMPYVLFQIGQAHFRQMTTPDRDQTPVRKALSNFEYLLENYPSSIFTRAASEKIPICRQSLAEHEFLIGNFYYRKGKYEGAASRFEAVFLKYGDLDIAPKALYYLGMSYLNLSLSDKAEEAFLALSRHYPDSEYVSKTENLLRSD
jgi:outer membrane protein assembly factor BamD